MSSTLQQSQEKNILYGLGDENRSLHKRLWERVIDRMFTDDFCRKKGKGIQFSFIWKGIYYCLEIIFPTETCWESDVTLYSSRRKALITEHFRYNGIMNHPLLVYFCERIIEQIFASSFTRVQIINKIKISFEIGAYEYYILISEGSWGDCTGDYFGTDFYLYTKSGHEVLSEFIFNAGESNNHSHPLEELRELAYCSAERFKEIKKAHEQLAVFG